MSALESTLETAQAILLDFDGPICDVFAGYPASRIANDMRGVLPRKGVAIPGGVADESDPLMILRWVAVSYEYLLREVEDVLCEGELKAVETSRPTPFLTEVIGAARQTGRSVAVVSNNSGDAIIKYLQAHQLWRSDFVVVGRRYGEPLRMKPDPSPLLRATESLGVSAGASVIVGDSVTDIEAARRAGARSIGFAKSDARAEQLGEAGADALVYRLDAVVSALLGGGRP